MCKISRNLLMLLEYEYGNVFEDGVIKQYMFTEDTTIDEAREFMNRYYPDVDFDALLNETD